ncbi:MAG: hypothetical protein GY696_13370, partial [Gammaproteobacteria bacterium]|nr:hypothetical protein [Gammaproteobacteria bacterium]
MLKASSRKHSLTLPAMFQYSVREAAATVPNPPSAASEARGGSSGISMESLLDFIKHQAAEYRAQLQQDRAQRQLDREHQAAMMRTVLESQKTTFQEMLSQSNQGTITSGGSTTCSTSQPHFLISSEYMDDGEDECTLP